MKKSLFFSIAGLIILAGLVQLLIKPKYEFRTPTKHTILRMNRFTGKVEEYHNEKWILLGKKETKKEFEKRIGLTDDIGLYEEIYND